MFEIHDTVEGVLMKGPINVEQSSSHIVATLTLGS
jgi:hypothetical protein